MFNLSRTFGNPGATQTGFAPVGAGAQQTGHYRPPPELVSREPVRPVQGTRSWLRPSSPQGSQRGFPSTLNRRQNRTTPGPVPPIFGDVGYHRGPRYDEYGADNFVPITGKIFTNPIGAGIVARYRPQASYGPAAQYYADQIFWTSQVIPTSTKLQGLTTPAALAAILSGLSVEGEYTTTG